MKKLKENKKIIPIFEFFSAKNQNKNLPAFLCSLFQRTHLKISPHISFGIFHGLY